MDNVNQRNINHTLQILVVVILFASHSTVHIEGWLVAQGNR